MSRTSSKLILYQMADGKGSMLGGIFALRFWPHIIRVKCHSEISVPAAPLLIIRAKLYPQVSNRFRRRFILVPNFHGDFTPAHLAIRGGRREI